MKVTRFRQLVSIVFVVASMPWFVAQGPTAALPGETSPVTSSVLLEGPAGSVGFGRQVLVLENGNYAVSDASWTNPGGTEVGAVHLYDGRTDTLISSLTGSNDRDGQGLRLYEVGTSNLIAEWPSWGADFGAITWIDGAAGLSGEVSGANSLAGTPGRPVWGDVFVLQSGDYVVVSEAWSEGGPEVGAVTFGSGAGGLVGQPSRDVSLVGSSAGDIRFAGVVELANGNYVIVTPQWSDGAAQLVGAVTWARRGGGAAGTISPERSLVGSQSGDGSAMRATPLTNGNYVVSARFWSNGTIDAVGAVTWGDGTGATSGVIGPQNSLIGVSEDDRVGTRVTALTNGNYVSGQPEWDRSPIAQDAGSATWVDGSGPTTGVVSSSNSVYGKSGDMVGTRVHALENGHALIRSSNFDLGFESNVGAITWMDGTQPTSTQVNAASSVVGSSTDDSVGRFVVTLSDGNAVLAAPDWDDGAVEDVGAVTWVDGTARTGMIVSPANSLVGTRESDGIGVHQTQFGDLLSVVGLSGGAYVVGSPGWDDDAGRADVGAVTWGPAGIGISGRIGSGNSLIGSADGDRVGESIVEGAPGSAFVLSPDWLSESGAATWMDSASRPTGALNRFNSFVGSPNQGLGTRWLRLSSGDLVVTIPQFDVGGASVGGAAWLDGTQGRVGVVSVSDALIGREVGDFANAFVAELETGDVTIGLPNFDDDGVADVGALALGVPGPDMAGTVGPQNAVIGGGSGASAPGVRRLTSSDSVAASTFEKNRVLLLRLDRPPVFEDIPEDLSVSAPSGVSEFVVHFKSPSAVDVRDGSAPSVCTPASGRPFPIGATAVTCVATDSAGFIATTDFTVTVTRRLAVRSVVPVRLLDTRASGETIDDLFEGAGRLDADGVIELQVTGRAGLSPDQAAAVVLNVTMIRPSGNGFVTVYPCGDRPVASSMNAPANGGVVANELVAKVDVEGKVCLYSSTPTDLAVDLTGFATSPDGLRTLDPARLLDTRTNGATIDDRFVGEGRLAAGETIEVAVIDRASVPMSDVGSVVLNVTMIRPSGNGFVTVFPCGTRPNASSMNAPAGGGVVANEVIAKVSATGTVCIFSSVETDLAADVSGYVPVPSGISSLDPARLLDTRSTGVTIDGRFEGAGQLPVGRFVELDVLDRGGVPTSGVGSVVLNVTMIRPAGNGFVTIYPCGTLPTASSMNAPAGGGVVANEVIAKVSTGGKVCLYTSVETDLAADITGYVAT